MSSTTTNPLTPLIPQPVLSAFAAGQGADAWQWLGAWPDAKGCRFAVWAPRAKAVSVVGDFNAWDTESHLLQAMGHGIWAGHVAAAVPGQRYKFWIKPARRKAYDKADPFARAAELRPGNASVIAAASRHVWHDGRWMTQRACTDWKAAPIAIYEVHLGSWRRPEDGREFFGYAEMAQPLADYAVAQGFTHIELMPIAEHPLDESWGYQTTGYYAPTARFGSADALRAFVDHLHSAGLGVILDWSAAHFPRDTFALARFDGGALFEHADPQRGEHPDWNSLIFDYDRPEVRSFLIGSALYWLQEFHFDGLRVDACASMLYLDYSRKRGEWQPNIHGGKENLDAVAFLQALNHAVHEAVPGTLTFAEESTAWPGVTRPSWLGGLGFDFKWNMGWMHDALDYLKQDPIHRTWHHDRLTFPALYAQQDCWTLPLSHDEVVHGKGSLLNKLHAGFAPDLPDAASARFATLRLLLAWQWLWPGKKLLFMGGEWGAAQEWDATGALVFPAPDALLNLGVQKLVSALNHHYRSEAALHVQDSNPAGFEWIDYRDARHSVVSWLRCGLDDFCLVVLNATPVWRAGYRVGVPHLAQYQTLLDTDDCAFGGQGLRTQGAVQAEDAPLHGRRYSIALDLPPLSVLLLKPLR